MSDIKTIINHQQAFLKKVKEKQEAVAKGTFKDPVRDLSQFLNNWQPLIKRVGL